MDDHEIMLWIEIRFSLTVTFPSLTTTHNLSTVPVPHSFLLSTKTDIVEPRPLLASSFRWLACEVGLAVATLSGISRCHTTPRPS